MIESSKSYEKLFEKITAFAQTDDDVCAMVLFGSRARSQKPADAYSDYDIILFVKDVRRFVKTDEWLKSIAPYHVSFVECAAVQDYERRVFFDNAMDVDFVLYKAGDAEKITNSDVISSWFSRGYRVVVDKMSYSELAANSAKRCQTVSPLFEGDFINLVQTFWFHAIWAEKKLMRGEMRAAKNCIDGYMKNLLWQVWKHQREFIGSTGAETWQDGRFLDDILTPEQKNALDEAYGKYNLKSLEDALHSTINLFSEAARELSQSQKYHYPYEAEEYARDMVAKIQN